MTLYVFLLSTIPVIYNVISLNLPVFQLLFVIYIGIVAIQLVNMLIAMMDSSSESLVINYQLTRCQHLAENSPHPNYARNPKCQ
jgi:hypothetical protein